MKSRLEFFGKSLVGEWTAPERLQEAMTRTRCKPDSEATIDLPTWSEHRTFTTAKGEVFSFERNHPDAPRPEPPVAVRGVWVVEGSGFILDRLTTQRDGKPVTLFDLYRGTGFNRWRFENMETPEEQTTLTRAAAPYCGEGRTPFVEIEFPDGRLEIASCRISRTAPSIESEVERIAAMNLREATEALLKQFPHVPQKTLHAGFLHMKGGLTWEEMKKAAKVKSKDTLSRRINEFYELTGFPKPDRRKGKGDRVQFDDTRDQPEHYGTKKGGRIEPPPEQFDFPE